MNPLRLLLRSWVPLSAQPWLAGSSIGSFVAFGVAKSQPYSITSAGKCALRLPLDQSWAGSSALGYGHRLVLVAALHLLPALLERLAGRRRERR